MDSTPGGGFSNSGNHGFSGIPVFLRNPGMLFIPQILGDSGCLWISWGISSLESLGSPDSAFRLLRWGILGDPGVSVGDPGVSVVLGGDPGDSVGDPMGGSWGIRLTFGGS